MFLRHITILACHIEIICWKIHQVVLDSIIENVAGLVQTDTYGYINIADRTTISNLKWNSCQSQTHYNKKQGEMEKSELLEN